jgi:cardiolipin synthase
MAVRAVSLPRGLWLALAVAGCGGVGPVDPPANDEQVADGDPPADGDEQGDEGAGAEESPELDDDAGTADAAVEVDAGGDGDDAGLPPQGIVGLHVNHEYMPLIDLIDEAAVAIDMELYEMFDSGVHAALHRALARGVQVRVVAEPAPVGQRCSVFEAEAEGDSPDCINAKLLVATVRQRGGVYEPYDKSVLCTSSRCVQHGKLAIFDGARALVSTGNFNASSLCSPGSSVPTCNRDYTVVSDDPKVVAKLTEVFEADLAASPYDLAALLGDELADELTVSPLSRTPLVAFIDSAERSLRVANQYLHEPELNDAIVAAARRGVDVQVMVASFCYFGRPSRDDVDTETEIFTAFDVAGVESRIFTRQMTIGGKPGYLHAKAIVVDDERAWVGSVNGSVAGTSANREFGLFFDEPDWVARLSRSLDRDFADERGESWRESLSCQSDP